MPTKSETLPKSKPALKVASLESKDLRKTSMLNISIRLILRTLLSCFFLLKVFLPRFSEYPVFLKAFNVNTKSRLPDQPRSQLSSAVCKWDSAHWLYRSVPVKSGEFWVK